MSKKNFILQTGAGDTFSEVAKTAKDAAHIYGGCEFDFNGIKCIVTPETDLNLLYRDYANAFTMEWKTVGPACDQEYAPNIASELKLRTENMEAKRELERIQQETEDMLQKAEVEEKVKGVTLLIYPEKQEEYAKYVENNSKDGYSRGVIEYAEYWAKLMQVEISKGRTEIKDIAEETQKPLGFLGITGFMYGCVIQTLAKFWNFGEELRRWHNKEYNHDGDGVVNPAILTISTK